MKPAIIRLHYNKRKAKEGLPWTIHTKGACIPAAHVRIHTSVETEEKPDNKHNPRYFLVCKGVLTWEGTTAVIFSGALSMEEP